MKLHVEDWQSQLIEIQKELPEGVTIIQAYLSIECSIDSYDKMGALRQFNRRVKEISRP